MITINKDNARISAWGQTGDVTDIYWYQMPSAQKRSTALDLSSAVIYARFYDGSTADVTSYCTFSPQNGTMISSDAVNITITAYYAAKSGTTFQSAITMPITYCVGLQIVTDSDYILYEQYYHGGSPLYDANKVPLDKDKIKVYSLYARAGGEEIVKAVPLDTDDYAIRYDVGYVGVFGGGYSFVDYVGANSNEQTDVTVYHTVETPGTESFTHAFEFHATATVEGQNFTSPHAYIETIPIAYFDYIPFPTRYGSVTFDKSGIVFVYKDGGRYVPIENYTDMWLLFSTTTPTYFSWQNTVTIDFADGRSGNLYIGRNNPRFASNPGAEPRYEYTHYSYECRDNQIYWTKEES